MGITKSAMLLLPVSMLFFWIVTIISAATTLQQPVRGANDVVEGSSTVHTNVKPGDRNSANGMLYHSSMFVTISFCFINFE